MLNVKDNFFIMADMGNNSLIMNDRLQQLLEQLPSFIVLGISIVLVINILILLLHVMTWGIVIGCIIWLFITLKNMFFSPRVPKKHKRIIIDHDEHH